MEGSAPIDIDLLNDALEKIVRGIYYYHSGGKKKLFGRLIVAPLFLGMDPRANIDERERLLTIQRFTKQDIEEIGMCGEFKKFFSYQVIEDDDVVVVNMIFYTDRIVSVMHNKK